MPLLPSILYEVHGSFTLGFLVSGGPTFLGAVAAFFAVPAAKRTEAESAGAKAEARIGED